MSTAMSVARHRGVVSEGGCFLVKTVDEIKVSLYGGVVDLCVEFFTSRMLFHS